MLIDVNDNQYFDNDDQHCEDNCEDKNVTQYKRPPKHKINQPPSILQKMFVINCFWSLGLIEIPDI